jgi:agmatine deiminase
MSTPLEPLQAAAEFNAQRAVWMSWPTYDHKRGVHLELTTIEIIRAISGKVKVEMLVKDASTSRRVRKLLPYRGLSIHVMPYSELWMRDFGPYFLTNGKQKAIADFGFDLWSYEALTAPTSIQHEKIDRTIAKRQLLPARTTGLIGEGGNREANGDGILMLVEAVERQRNPKLSLEQIEAKLKIALGAKKVIWLKQGLVEDGMTNEGPISGDFYLPMTTGGHIDNVARFVSPRTILLAEVTKEEATKSEINRENRRRLEENYRILSNATDLQGNLFKIYRMPAADLHYEMMRPGDAVYDMIASMKFSNGHKFPVGKPVKVAHAASYMNFLITNGLVITSRLFREGAPIALKSKDEETVVILKTMFPDRKIVSIDSRPINLGGGGIHCITANEPK